MVPEIKDHIVDIINTCRLMQVKSLYLFGSATKNKDFRDSSDLDFLFQFKKDEEGMLLSHFDYFDLMHKLQEITGRKVDLVAEEKITNPFFLRKIDAEKILIYED